MTAKIDEIAKVFREHLRLEDSAPVDNLEYNITQGWDSLTHLNIIAGLEETFNVMIDTDDVLDMSSFKKAVEIMNKYETAD